jgi:transcriptional regulator with PAS, ATPase and Fis domain
MEYKWPGNVRELRNIVNRMAFIFPDETISAEMLRPMLDPDNICVPGTHVHLENSPIQKAESTIIREALERNNGNISKSCRELNISRATLYAKMKKYEL